MTGAHLVREARRRAGISQTELARRAGTTQSAVARLEAGRSAPSLEHLSGLVRACGFDIQLRLVPYDVHDWTLVEQSRLSEPSERLRRMLAAVRFAEAGREALESAGGRDDGG